MQRRAASCCQPLQLSDAPRGARIILDDIYFSKNNNSKSSAILDLMELEIEMKKRIVFKRRQRIKAL